MQRQREHTNSSSSALQPRHVSGTAVNGGVERSSLSQPAGRAAHQRQQHCLAESHIGASHAEARVPHAALADALPGSSSTRAKPTSST
eukprot:6131367-Prymnesium_polylepis.1